MPVGAQSFRFRVQVVGAVLHRIPAFIMALVRPNPLKKPPIQTFLSAKLLIVSEVAAVRFLTLICVMVGLTLILVHPLLLATLGVQGRVGSLAAYARRGPLLLSNIILVIVDRSATLSRIVPNVVMALFAGNEALVGTPLYIAIAAVVVGILATRALAARPVTATGAAAAVPIHPRTSALLRKHIRRPSIAVIAFEVIGGLADSASAGNLSPTNMSSVLLPPMLGILTLLPSYVANVVVTVITANMSNKSPPTTTATKPPTKKQISTKYPPTPNLHPHPPLRPASLIPHHPFLVTSLSLTWSLKNPGTRLDSLGLRGTCRIRPGPTW